MILDLNAKRAARAARRGEGMQMILDEQTFDLVDELPIELGEMANEGRFIDALKMMLRDPEGDWERLKDCKPSFNDVLDIVEYFGTQLGESVRSIESSRNTGPPSNSTSTAISGGTSPATVTAIDPSMLDDLSGTSDTFPQSPPSAAS